MLKDDFDQGLLQFLAQSPTPFHATHQMSLALDLAGFTKLEEGDCWDLEPHVGYYITRNQSSIIAWRQPESFDNGIRMVGAHTDSPCLRVKPIPELFRKGYYQLGVEVY